MQKLIKSSKDLYILMDCPVLETLTISNHCDLISSNRFRDLTEAKNRPTSQSKLPSKLSRNSKPKSVTLYPNGLYPAGIKADKPPPRGMS